MVIGITSISSDSSISQQITTDIEEADSLLDSLKKEDVKTTTKQLSDLLIQYILAQISNDSAGAKAIQDQISSVVETYGDDIQKANDLKGKLKAVESNPNAQTASELAYLQNLIATLKQDVTSGNMSNF